MLPGFVVVGVALRRVVPGGSATTGTDGTVATDRGTATVRETAAAVVDAVRSRGVGLAVPAATLMLFIFQGLTAFFTTYLVYVKGLSKGTAGLLFGFLFVSGAVWQSVGGGPADRYGHGPVLAVIAFSGVLPLVALPFVSSTLAPALVSALLGVRLAMGGISNAYVVSLLPADIRGTASATRRPRSHSEKMRISPPDNHRTATTSPRLTAPTPAKRKVDHAAVLAAIWLYPDVLPVGDGELGVCRPLLGRPVLETPLLAALVEQFLFRPGEVPILDDPVVGVDVGGRGRSLGADADVVGWLRVAVPAIASPPTSTTPTTHSPIRIPPAPMSR